MFIWFFRLYPRHEPPEFLGHFAAGENRFMKYDDVTKKEFVAVNVGDSFGPRYVSFGCFSSVLFYFKSGNTYLYLFIFAT